MPSGLDDREKCCWLVENGATKATTTFLVDESGKTVIQLVYDLSEEHYGFEVMKESSRKFHGENLCYSCDSGTAEGDLDKELGLPASIQDTESFEPLGAQTSNPEWPEAMCDKEECKEQANVEVISNTEMETNLTPSDGHCDVGSILDCKSGIGEVESKTEVNGAITQNMTEAKKSRT